MKRKLLKKARIENVKEVLLDVDPEAFYRKGIMIPHVKYQVVACVEMKEVFDGPVMPFPLVLLRFLNHMELQVMTVIMEEIFSRGRCAMTLADIVQRLSSSTPTVSTAMYNLRKMGLLYEGKHYREGFKYERIINYKAVKHLYELSKDEDPGVFARIRKCTRKTSILNLTKEDIAMTYTQHILPPNHDPEEEEVYD